MTAGIEPDPVQPRRAVGSGAALSSIGVFGSAAIGGVLAIVVARLLGPVGTGEYNVVMSAFLVLLTGTTLGVNVGAGYYVASRRWSRNNALAQVQVAAVIAGGCGALIGLAVAVVGRDSLFSGVGLETVIPVLIALPFALSWTFVTGLAVATDRYETYAVAPLAVNALALGATLVLVPLDGVRGATVAIAVGHIVVAVAVASWGLRRFGRPSPGWLRETPSHLRAATTFGIKSHLTQLIQLLQQRADLFVLNAVASKTTVGQYSIALAITELGILLPRALSAVIVPRIADLTASREAEAQRLVAQKSIRHVILLLPLVALILATGVLLIPLVFGADFAPAVGPGLILIPGVSAMSVAYVLAATIVGRGKPGLVASAALLSAPITGVLYAVLIPAYHAYGAAIASTLCYSATACVTLVFFRRVDSSMSLRSLLPGRSEFDDYQTLVVRFRARRGDK